MQEQINDKTISLCITGGKISGKILKFAITKALAKMEKHKREKAAEKNTTVYHGKLSMEKLMKQNCELSNIEITDGNIKSFEKYARKYNIDFSLKKDKSVEPPRYYVFFKAKDVDVMTAAFREYTAGTLEKNKKPSIRKKLALAIERVTKHRQREKTRQKDRGPEH